MSYQSLDKLFNKNKQKSRLQFWNGFFKKYNKPEDDPGIKQEDIVEFVSMQFGMNPIRESKGKTTNTNSSRKTNKNKENVKLESANDGVNNMKKGHKRVMQCLNENRTITAETKNRRKILAPNENTIFIKENSNVCSNSKSHRKGKQNIGNNVELSHVKLESPEKYDSGCFVKLMRVDVTEENPCKIEIKSEDIPTSKKRTANSRVDEYEKSIGNDMCQVSKSQRGTKKVKKSKSCVCCEEADCKIKFEATDTNLSDFLVTEVKTEVITDIKTEDELEPVMKRRSPRFQKIKLEAVDTNLGNSIVTEVIKTEVVADTKMEDKLVSVIKRRSPRLQNIKLEANNGNSEVNKINSTRNEFQSYLSEAQLNTKTKDIKPILKNKCNAPNKSKLPTPPKHWKLKENVVYLVHPLVKKELMTMYPEMCQNKRFGPNKTYNEQRLDQTVFYKDSSNADELQTKILIEKKLQSDLAQRLFERYCAQQQNSELFKFWNNAVKQELLRLKKVVSFDKLGRYMITALNEKIALCNKNRKEEQRYSKRGRAWHNTM